MLVKSNVTLLVEFTNGNLSRKFVKHGTFFFQPREKPIGKTPDFSQLFMRLRV